MRQYLAIGLTVSALLVVALIGMNYQMFGYAGLCVPEDKQRRTMVFAELEREIAKMRDETWADLTFGYRTAYFNLTKSLCPSVITEQDRHEAEKLGPIRWIRVFSGDNSVEVTITVEADSVLANDVALARSVSSDLDTEFTGQFEISEFPLTVRYSLPDGSVISEAVNLESAHVNQSGNPIINGNSIIVYEKYHEAIGDDDLLSCPDILLYPPPLGVPSTVETVESILTVNQNSGVDPLDARDQIWIEVYGGDAWWRWQLEFQARLNIAEQISSTVTGSPVALSIQPHADPFSIAIEKTFCMTNSIYDDQKKTLAIHAWLKAEP